MQKVTFRSDLRRNLLAGLGALLPTFLTLLVLVQLYKFVDSSIGQPVNRAIKAQFRSEAGQRFLVEHWRWDRKLLEDKEEFSKQLDRRYPRYIGTFFGLIVATVAIYFVGHFMRSYLGRRLFALTEYLLAKFPVVKVIYPHAKQLTQFFFAERKVQFNTVVAVQYPRRGIFAIGFLTGDGLRDVTDAMGQPSVSVFIPSSPTPFTGYVIMVPAEEVVELDMTVEQAFRFTITGGVIVPPAQAAPGALGAIGPPPELKRGGSEPSPAPGAEQVAQGD